MDNPKYLNERWESNFLIPFNASFGYYDFRVRVNDSDGDYSQWLYANDSLLIYNLQPKVINIELSKSTVYRTDLVFLYVNGLDYETPESMLTFYAQYKTPNNEWNDLSGEYSITDNHWEIEFITNKNSILGVYDFRVKFIDNESAPSGWQYLNDSLEVLNNIPVVVDLNVSHNIVYRTESLKIYSNGTDIEDLENVLNCTIQYRYTSGNWLDFIEERFSSNHWEVLYSPTVTEKLGFYNLRVNYTDEDGDYSGWMIIEDAFEVKNNPPLISDLCDDFEVGNSIKDFDLTQYESDIEDIDENLTWDIDQSTIDTTLFLAGINDIDEDILRIVPEDNIFGSDEISLILRDKDGGTCRKTDVTIYINSVINKIYNVSISVFPESIEIEQGKSAEVVLTVFNSGNIADNYNINFSSNDFTDNDIRFKKSNILLSSGDKVNITINLTVPVNMKIDSYNFSIIAKSDYASDNTTLEVIIKPKSTGERPGEKEDDIMFSINIWIILIIIIIIVITFILFVLFIKRKNRQKQKDALNEETITANSKESSIPEKELSEDSISPSPPKLQTATNSTPKLTSPPTATPTTISRQITQVSHMPQLPPAQSQSTITDSGETTITLVVEPKALETKSSNQPKAPTD